LTYLIYLVVLLVLAGNASAYTTWEWDGGGPNDVWNEPLNWDDGVGGNGVPVAGDAVEVNIPDPNCLIDSNTAAVCGALKIGESNGPAYLDMTGGTLSVTTMITLADEPNGIAFFTMTGGTVSCAQTMKIGEGGSTGSDGVGTLRMRGGEFNGGSKVQVGKNPTGIGYLYMDGGTIVAADDIEMGNYGNATMVMTGGDVNAVDTLKLGAGDGSYTSGTATIFITDGNIYSDELRLGSESHPEGTATIYLEGGFIYTDTINIFTANGKIDINEGTLKVEIESTELAKIKEYKTNGKIIAYNGVGIVDINEKGGEVTVTGRRGDPNLAWMPSPGDDAPSVVWTSAGPALSWNPGRYAADVNGHEVYFGTDDANVEDANNAPGVWTEFMGIQSPCSLPFPSPPPVLGETYYWRIDEVNDVCDPCSWKGEVWKFTMANYVVAEDFESYASTDDLNDVWILTGSDISIETTIVKSKSTKSMKYEYTNGTVPHYTEAKANTIGSDSLQLEASVGRDWTKADIKALVVNFYGKAGNATTQMYVALRDTDGNLATVYYDDLNDVNEPEWHEWNIKLSDFKKPTHVNDVNLSDVNEVYIGFGNRETPAAGGGSGTVYFDDIRLYPTRCVPVYGPYADIGGPLSGSYDYDCRVDNVDVNIMAGEWLEADYNGIGRAADVNGSWVDEGVPYSPTKRGKVVELDGVDNWVDLDDTGFSDFHDKTIAFWVRIKEFPSVYPYLFYFSDDAEGSDPELDPYRIQFMTYAQDGDTYPVRVRFLDDYTTAYNAGLNAWTHLAFVIADTPDGMCTGTFYADGLPRGTPMTGRPRHSGGAYGVNIGSEDDGQTKFVNARFDDFRVYDRALTEDDIYEWIKEYKEPGGNLLYHYDFNETTGLTAANSSNYPFYHPLLSVAELYDSEDEGFRKINLRDFSVLANDWLKEQLWP